MLKALNRNRYHQINKFSWSLDFSVTVKRKKRFLEKKVLKTQRKPLKLLNQFKTESLDEIGRTQEKVNVLCDNQSAMHLATNPAYHSRTKHIDVRYHFLRHVIDGGKVALQKVHTQENCADIFTKPVTVEKLRWCLASLGLQKR